ncbi:MAG: hypothetical protein JHD02_03850 [Thermoleophilaceae bacterium]|nr:hypothetical protein [Thermoleophilaceae bacterium]
MIRTVFKTVRAALLAFAAVAAFASTATAASQQYDSSYKTVLLPTGDGAGRIAATSCEALTKDTFAIVGKIGGNGPSESASAGSHVRTAILTADANGRSRLGWRRVNGRAGETLAASDFAASGEFTYINSLIAGKKALKLIVRRARPDGRPSSRWKDATINLPAIKGRATFTNMNVLNLRDGGVLVVVHRRDKQRLYRFDPTGKPSVSSFGTKGRLTLAPVSTETWYLPTDSATPLLETHDGSLIVAASARPGESAGKAIGLLKLSANGTPVQSFGDRGLWTPPTAFRSEQPLAADSSREAPLVNAVLGGETPGASLTVLFSTRTRFAAGTATWTGAARLSEVGAQQSISEAFDQATDSGDTGFPDAQPFGFIRTATGLAYAAGWSQLYATNKARGYGTLATLATDLGAPLKLKSVTLPASRFFAMDYAPTPDGRYVYACGAIASGSSAAKNDWKTYSAALRRFKL